MSVWSIVVAAGTGSRLGGAKQFRRIAGRRVVDWSLDTARAASAGVVVVVPPTSFPIEGLDADAVAIGGATRSQSVRAGLARVPDDVRTIIVHDAARPLASLALYRAVITALADPDLEHYGVQGAVPVVDVVDSVRDHGSSIPRDGLKLVQTPQAFHAWALRDAHASRPESSDDSSLVGMIAYVAGERTNIKLTEHGDLEHAEALLAARALALQ